MLAVQVTFTSLTPVPGSILQSSVRTTERRVQVQSGFGGTFCVEHDPPFGARGSTHGNTMTRPRIPMMIEKKSAVLCRKNILHHPDGPAQNDAVHPEKALRVPCSVFVPQQVFRRLAAGMCFACSEWENRPRLVPRFHCALGRSVRPQGHRARSTAVAPTESSWPPTR